MCRAWGRFQAACQINEVRQGNRPIQKYSRWNEYNICTNPKRVSLLICYSLLHSLVLYQGVVWIQLQQSAYTRYLGVVRGHKTNMIFHITNFTPQAQAVWEKSKWKNNSACSHSAWMAYNIEWVLAWHLLLIEPTHFRLWNPGLIFRPSDATDSWPLETSTASNPISISPTGPQRVRDME